MRFLTIFLTVVGIWGASAAGAQNRPYQLVCFEKSGLTDSLNKVVNAQQFLRNDRLLKSGSCDFVRIPAGSTARYAGIHASRNGFLYPMYAVRYATTGQRMYAADGIFKAQSWTVKSQRGTAVTVLTPASCDVLDGYLQVSPRLPRYIVVPRICDVEVIQ